MQANFEGLIQLLAKNLYPEPDVFVRELIQNAHDSIRLRQEREPGLEARIEVEVRPDESMIVFRDNGLGMDRQDIKQFLSVIGSTGTGAAREQLRDADRAAAYSLIGQFGIGMLSAFVVAAEVVVRTRKLGSSDAFAWHNAGSTECELRLSDEPKDPGSEILVKVARTHGFILEGARLEEAIVKYCDFIPFPIRLNGSDPLNAMDAPWHREHWPSQAEKEAAYKLFLEHRYPDIALDVIPVEIDAPYRARGALYISDRRLPDFNTAGVVDLFVRRMFVRANDAEVLPAWAKFVRGVIDSPDLQPTAARDNVQRDDEAFEFLRLRLGELILERLTVLAKQEPKRFREINRWHHYHLKGMALHHDDFFDAVADLLLFETNKGLKPLKDCLQADGDTSEAGAGSRLFYFAEKDAAPQFYRLAAARDWVVVNAGHLFEQEFLAKYAEDRAGSVRLVPLDSAAGLFERPSLTGQDRQSRLELDVEAALRRAGISNVLVRLRSFAPSSMPAIALSSAESEAEIKLRQLVKQPWFMESFEDVSREALQRRKRQPLQLILNHRHPLVRWLLDRDTRAEQLRPVMVGLYLSSLLYSRNLLTDETAEIVHGHLALLLDKVARCESTIGDLRVSRGPDDPILN
jgi:molecular chaperone HtpG